jgi:hypothetical protein
MESKQKTDIADPLILLAPGRCFSSLVCAMLGQHPQMYALLETQLFARDLLSEWWEDFGSNIHAHGLLRSVAELVYGHQSPAAVKQARRWLWTRRDCRTADIFAELAEQVFPLVLIEKTPMITYRPEHMERAHAAFPNARFLHLVRHPVGFCRSLLEFFQARAPQRHTRQVAALIENPESIFYRMFDETADVPTLDPQMSWYLRQSQVIAFTSTLPEGQALLVRAEDLLSEAETNLRHICEWLGVRSDPAAIEEMMHPERSPLACLGPWNARFGGDPTFLRNPILEPRAAAHENLEDPLPWREDGEPFGDHVGQLARALGYS